MSFDPRGPLPIIALRDTLILPGTLVPLILGRAGSVEAVKKSNELHGSHVIMILQKNPALENIHPNNLYKIGILASIHSTHQLPGGMMKVTAEALKIVEISHTEAFGEVLVAEHKPFDFVNAPSKEASALKSQIIEKMERYLMTRSDLPDNVLETLGSVESFNEFLMSAAPLSIWN